MEALSGSIRETVLCGSELVGTGDEVSPKNSAAVTRFCGVLLVCLSSSLSSSACGACVLSSKSYSCSVSSWLS